MLNGRETIQELIQRYPQTEKILADFGITVEKAEKMGFKNLAQAALNLKIPFVQILYTLSKATGEKIQTPNVRGLTTGRSGLKKGIPDGVKRVIAVHSGKGGVGKTFVTVNLAVFLAQKGYKVGVLDADIDCPNVLLALGLEGKLVASADKKIVPLRKHGLKVISMASIEEMANRAIMWRGPVISKVIEQFVHDTDWGELDFLLVDLPPGTSDAPLSVLQILRGAEVLVVTTGQKLALLDAKKSISMCRELQASILGVVENMSGRMRMHNPVSKFAQKEKCTFLVSIPFKTDYAEMMDEGQPVVLSDKKLEKILEDLEEQILRKNQKTVVYRRKLA